ncbi:MAG: hypothetical protein A4S17_06995 [Proteobacteria bacterium HN_bin10]|nr:MAG: hypothetical protein A4S17_06995 [Proteobacteria bacterium HN_bin10]
MMRTEGGGGADEKPTRPIGPRLRLLAVFAAIAAIVVAAGAMLHAANRAQAFYHFEDIAGPAGRDTPPAITPTQLASFERGSEHRLAILVTDAQSQWLGLARAFRAAGVPFTMTTDAARALRHRVVMVYPIISGRALAPEALRGLARHVRAGGTLIGFDLQGGGLEPVFGVSGSDAARTRETLRWSDAAPEEALTYFTNAQSEAPLASHAFQLAGATVAARYEDGSAGVVCNDSGGRACLMGVDLGLLARRAFDGRTEQVGRDYVNVFEPSLDVMVRWVRDLYVEGEPMPWLFDTAPPGREVAIVLTHDIDYTRSVENAAAYAAMEREAGVRATYFLQTKYIRDYNDDVFLTRETAPLFRDLALQGMEIASHSVSHAYAFRNFPFGRGDESYPSYRPYVESRTAASGGTVLGELRVSRYLLEHFTGAPVRSFRPGHLSHPFRLPEALVATGYLNSSSMMAGASLTHLPFQTTFGREGESLAPVFEFPVTIEDEKPPRLGDRFDAANEVIEQIARRRGLVVVLIHTDITGHKLEFERRLIERWRSRAWIGALDEYAAWWRARDALDIDVTGGEGAWTATIHNADDAQPIAVLFPRAASANRNGDGVRLANGRLIVDGAADGARITWR